MSAAKKTIKHEIIREWVEERGGRPARVADTASDTEGSTGILRIDFAEPTSELEQISWDEFFETFDNHKLAFLYQDEKNSRFVKFVHR